MANIPCLSVVWHEPLVEWWCPLLKQRLAGGGGDWPIQSSALDRINWEFLFTVQKDVKEMTGADIRKKNVPLNVMELKEILTGRAYMQQG